MLRVMEAIPRVPRLTTASTSPIAAKQRSIEPQPPHLASKHSVQEALRIGFAIQKARSLAMLPFNVRNITDVIPGSKHN